MLNYKSLISKQTWWRKYFWIKWCVVEMTCINSCTHGKCKPLEKCWWFFNFTFFEFRIDGGWSSLLLVLNFILLLLNSIFCVDVYVTRINTSKQCVCFCLLSGFGTPLNYIRNQENNNPDRFALAHVIPLQSLWWGNCYTYNLQGLISDIVFEQIL